MISRAEDFAIDPTTLQAPARRIRPDHADIARAAALLARAKRPLILSGGGIHISQGYDALLAFAEAQSIPVAHTMSGKGGIPCTHPLSAGLFGRYSRIANELIEASDCLLVVGCKLGEIATKRFALPSRPIPLIHLEIVAEEIGRCLPADVALWGDARAGLEDLAQALADDARQARAARADYVAEIPQAHGGVARGGRGPARFRRAPDPHGAALPRAEPRAPGRQHPRRRWRVRRPLDRAPLRHQDRRPPFHPRPRPRLDRLRVAGRDRRRPRRASRPRSSRSAATAAST